MTDKSQQLQGYLDAMTTFLNSPAAVHALQHAPVTVDIGRLLDELYELCCVPGLTVKDEEWLRSIGISVE